MQALKKAGVQVLLAPLDKQQQVDLPAAIAMLHDMGLQSILVEGGSTVQGSFFDHRLVDKIYAFIGNKIIGGRDALSSVGGQGVDSLDECIPLHYDAVELHEGNVLITAYNADREGAYVHWHH